MSVDYVAYCSVCNDYEFLFKTLLGGIYSQLDEESMLKIMNCVHHHKKVEVLLAEHAEDKKYDWIPDL